MSAMAIDSSAAAAARPIPPSPLQAPNGNREAPAEVAEANMSFWDFLDVINPLHHIPLVGSVYRSLTGDEIGGPARVMGGILFGGVIGGVAAVANAIVEDTTGKDVGDHALVAMGLGEDSAAATAVTSNPATTQSASASAAAASVGTPSPAAVPAGPATADVAMTAMMAPAMAAERSAESRPAEPAATTPARDPFAAAAGQHRPSRMPARDTILANTAQARHAAALTQAQMAANTATAAAAIAGLVPPGGVRPDAPPSPSAPTPAAVAAPPAAAAAPALPEAAFPQPVAKEALSEVMLRNLAKYEQARKAAQRPAPGVEVSG